MNTSSRSQPSVRPQAATREAEPSAAQNLRDVRDLIASLPPRRFNMATFAATFSGKERDPLDLNHHCRTAGCIAGWALALRSERTGEMMIRGGYVSEAAGWLGLDYDVASQLFIPDDVAMNEVSQAAAVATLDHLIETGEVRWPTDAKAVS